MATPPLFNAQIPQTTVERDYFGNLIGSTTVNPSPITTDPGPTVPNNPPHNNFPNGWAWGFWANPSLIKDKMFNQVTRGVMDQYDSASDFSEAIATMDPGNPSYPVPEGSSLYNYLQKQPTALEWLRIYANNLRNQTQYSSEGLNLNRKGRLLLEPGK